MSTHVFGDVIWDDHTMKPLAKAADTPLAAKIWAQYGGGLEKSAADAASRPLISREELDRNVAIAKLEKASAEWLSVADDRTSGCDPEIRLLYRAKAAKAAAEAARLNGEPAKPKADPVKAARLEQEAAHHDHLATGSTDPGVRRYHRMMARDKRDAAAAARGEVLVPDSAGPHRETR